ncbi:MAG TPA: response regulator [Thermoleophilia bacterium]|nr:response regulator [Thermoleophilia bacterium]
MPDGTATPPAPSVNEAAPKRIIEVLIADDHELVRSGIRHALERTGTMRVSAEAATGSEAISILALAQDYVRDSFSRALDTYPGGAVTFACADSDAALEHAERERPQLVIVSADLEPLDGYATVQEINARVPGVSTLIVAANPSPNDFRRALQAGARDMLQLPVEKKDLFAALGAAVQVSGAKRSALEGITAKATAIKEKPIARRVVVFSTKGGTGKTFLSTNLAAGLAATGKRVALVDLDLQFGDVSIALGIVPQRTIYDLVQGYTDFDLALLRDFMLPHPASGMFVLPAPLYPEQGDEITDSDVTRLLEAIQEDYDFVIVDTPPFFEERVLAALDWADDILLVGSLDLATLKNLKLSLASMELMSYPVEKIRIVMNRADSKVGLELADVERHLGRAVRYSISSSIEVPRALNTGEVLAVQRPNLRVSQELKAVIDDYAGSVNGAAPRRFGFRRKPERTS